MAKIKPNLNQADIELLIEVMKMHFVTQDQFEGFRSDAMNNFDLLLKNMSDLSDEFVAAQARNEQRLDRLETVLDLPAIT